VFIIKKKHANIIIQFIKFGLVGLSNTVISYLIYSFLVYINVYYILASIIAFIVSVLNSFFWNRRFVFGGKQNSSNIRRSMVKTFISYGLTGLVLQNILLFIFVDVFYFSKFLAPFFGLCVTVPLNFFLNKHWVFNS
jgi:putative flippase GtrA